MSAAAEQEGVGENEGCRHIKRGEIRTERKRNKRAQVRM